MLKSFSDEYNNTKAHVAEISKKQQETAQQVELLTSRLFPHPEKGNK
jgi:hypothetical protein